MGTLVRHYWVPAFTSSALPTQGSDPIRVRLFGERFVAFRGEDGKIGFLDEGCPHRGASLVLARQEGCALRCIYHGWKIDASGEILETPNADRSLLRSGFRARSYPVEESHGLVWVYLGDSGTVPRRPTYEWEQLPEENVLAVDVDLDCNWAQSLEGLLDSAHTGILHTDVLNKYGGAVRDSSAMALGLLPRLEVEATDFGYHYGAIREGSAPEGGKGHVRITAYAAPFITFIPPTGQVFISAPMDDTHTKFFNVWWDPGQRLDEGPGYDHRIEMWGLHERVLRSTGMGPVPQPVNEIGWVNNFLQDREAMRAGQSFSGLEGVTAEDAAISVGMGALVDRTKEHLVASDIAITRMRRMLLREARNARDGGVVADWQGGKTPYAQIRSASGDIAPGTDWRDLVPEHVADVATRPSN